MIRVYLDKGLNKRYEFIINLLKKNGGLILSLVFFILWILLDMIEEWLGFRTLVEFNPWIILLIYIIGGVKLLKEIKCKEVLKVDILQEKKEEVEFENILNIKLFKPEYNTENEVYIEDYKEIDNGITSMFNHKISKKNINFIFKQIERIGDRKDKDNSIKSNFFGAIATAFSWFLVIISGMLGNVIKNGTVAKNCRFSIKSSFSNFVVFQYIPLLEIAGVVIGILLINEFYKHLINKVENYKIDKINLIKDIYVKKIE